MRPRQPSDGEEGAVLVTVLFSIIALLAMAALVLDLAAVRVNRAVSQTVADSAATAAALDAEGFNGQKACETALDYLELNLPQAGPLDACEAGVTPAASTVATAGSWVATLTYPVADGSPLLTSSAIGQPTQPLLPEDGDPCERFGVSIQGTHNYIFGRLLGATSATTNIHAVARGFVPDGHQFALNLLILERYECDALSVNTSGGGGGIVVDAVLNGDTGLLDQGFIAVDSDASAGCGGPGVIGTSGGGALIRSDGPDGCVGQIGSHVGPGGLTVGEGCGQIQLIAPGVPGCNWPACTNSGLIAPDPVPRRKRITRAPVDHRYNCKSSYNFGVGWEIDPCTETPAPYIDNMVASLGGPGIPVGYLAWQADLSNACSPAAPLVVPPGNYYIDCPNFRPGDVTFQGGNIIFEKNLSMTGSDTLVINNPAVTESIVFFRSTGAISMTGGSLTINHATVHMSDHHNTDISITGGDISWSAPTTGVFQDLALWYESTQDVKFAGGGALDLDGVFFAPVAEIGYQGNGGQSQVSAQFVSRRLRVGGNGTLVVRPSWERAVLFPFDPQTDLIR
jgi:hypothetical protein